MQNLSSPIFFSIYLNCYTIRVDDKVKILESNNVCFYRAMLSSAHVLAMDAKNLLDVIDSIRINYPMVDQMITRSANLASRSSVSTSGSPSASSSAASSLEKHREVGGVRLGSC